MQKNNTLAVVSLVLGIVSYFALPVIGAIGAIICGHLARAEIKRTGEAGDGMAVAGLVLGYLHFVVTCLVFTLFFGFFASLLGIAATQH
jgi:hypothetical protein